MYTCMHSLPSPVLSIFFYLYLFLGFSFSFPRKKRKVRISRMLPFFVHMPTPAYIAHTMSTYVYMYKFFFSLGVGVSWCYLLLGFLFLMPRKKRFLWCGGLCFSLHMYTERFLLPWGKFFLIRAIWFLCLFSPPRKELLLSARRWLFILFCTPAHTLPTFCLHLYPCAYMYLHLFSQTG